VKGRAEGDVPGRGAEAVAVALMELSVAWSALTPSSSPGGRGELQYRLLQYLRLLAFMQHLGEQPEVVPFAARVVGDFQ